MARGVNRGEEREGSGRVARNGRGARQVRQWIAPEVPEDEVEDYPHPADGGHHETMGYDPFTGSWDRKQFGTDFYVPDPWEGPMPPIKRPDDSDHDYDGD